MDSNITKLLTLIFLILSFDCFALGTSDRVIESKGNIHLLPSTKTYSAKPLHIEEQSALRLEDFTGGQYIGIKAPVTVATSFDFTLPGVDGSAGQCLKTDGSLVLSFGDCSEFVALNDNRLLRSNTGGGADIQESGITVDDLDQITGVTAITTASATINGSFAVVSTSTPSIPAPVATQAQIDLMPTGEGRQAYNSTTKKLNIHDGVDWTEVGAGGGGGFDNLLTDGDYEQAAASGENGLTCGAGNTCAQTDVAGEFANGAAGLKVTMGGSNPVDVKHCFANAGDAWINRMAQVSAAIKSDITDLQFCYNNNTTDEQCVNVGNATDFTKPIARSGVNSGEQICYHLKTATNPTASAEIFIDTAKAGEFDVDGTTKVLIQSIRADTTTAYSSNNLAVIYYSNIRDNSGDQILEVVNSSTDGFYIQALRDAIVDLNIRQNYTNLGNTIGFSINPTSADLDAAIDTLSAEKILALGISAESSNYEAVASASVKLKKGDFVYAHARVASLGVTGRSGLTITAKAYEQADVLTQQGYSGASIQWDDIAGCNPLTTAAVMTTINDVDCTFAVADKIGNPVAPAVSGDIQLRQSNIPSGKYEICVAGPFFADNAAGQVCQFQLADNAGNIISGAYLASEAAAYGRSDGFCGMVEYNTPQTDLIWSVQGDNVVGSAGCGMFGAPTASTNAGIRVSMKPVAQTIIGTFGAAVNSTIVHLKGGIGTPASSRNPLNFDTVTYDPDGNFDISTDEYTIPESGFYIFQAGLLISTTASSGYFEIDIQNQTAGITLATNMDTTGGDITGHRKIVTAPHYGTKGDKIRVRIFTGVSHTIPAIGGDLMFFSATKVDQAGVINKKADLKPECAITTVASTCAGWSQTDGRAYPRQGLDGTWYVDIHFGGSKTSGTSCSLDFSGTPFSPAVYEACKAFPRTTGTGWFNASIDVSPAGRIFSLSQDAQTSMNVVCTNVKLASKPTISGCDF